MCVRMCVCECVTVGECVWGSNSVGVKERIKVEGVSFQLIPKESLFSRHAHTHKYLLLHMTSVK